MSIKIEEIHAQGIGPIKEFSEKMGDINLIYGNNEQGKTFLVEFILKSLFKNLKDFKLRAGDPSGTLLVSGLGEESITFAPKARQKLEDYWEANIAGMPPNIARLLVVKGAELELDESQPGGVSKSIIKSFLSGKSTLDFIQNKIQKTIQNAKVESGNIIGDERGEIKKMNELRRDLTSLDDLLARVDLELSSGQIIALNQSLCKLNDQFVIQQEAKRYEAYSLSGKILEIERELSHIQENGLDKLLEDLKEWKRLNVELEDKQQKLETAERNSQHYRWIENAIVDYEKMLSRGAMNVKNWFVILGVILLLLGMGLIAGGILLSLFLENAGFGAIVAGLGLGLLFLGVILGYFYIQQYKKSQSARAETEELKRISDSYQQLFGVALRDLSTLKTHKARMDEDYHKAKILKDEIEADQLHIKTLGQNIESCFERFKVKKQAPESWQAQAEKILANRNQLREERESLKLKLAGLSVPPDEFRESDPGIQFDDAGMKRIQEELNETEQLIHEEERGLDSLKAEILASIHEKNVASWDDLLEKLRLYRNRIAVEYKKQASQILAGIIVNNVINLAREQEDDNIKTNLESLIVTEPLHNITGRYLSIRMKEDRLRVADKFNEFGVEELSTGAREQVLLALRVGFASKILGHDAAFIILDDAFQHSDWQRRENLVKQTLSLGKKGWQILYFSMDEHIKGLFDKYGKKEFGDAYRSINLSN